ncbi:hypothetical protein BDP55DRAFT_680612 [Colletotrichum godetiae]|uniref:Uncharacterized protein n=1 Tax=Colletotrichum godetiae TaxID=1209918 RepID=A0AAJ0ACN3_9PEZI|nr:uncharacterized protein BDP55DRAFT_680612 [Colletotrichum godetiae]KAK1659182.1 hypothetical protein BDP55DRAFT_680612 [Colletotrichum godetiae]
MEKRFIERSLMEALLPRCLQVVQALMPAVLCHYPHHCLCDEALSLGCCWPNTQHLL